MKNFSKPFCEVVRFNNAVLTASNCGCWDGEDDWGIGANCKGDTPTCECGENYNPAIANCITQPGT